MRTPTFLSCDKWASMDETGIVNVPRNKLFFSEAIILWQLNKCPWNCLPSFVDISEDIVDVRLLSHQ
jgi:hypothetical protein